MTQKKPARPPARKKKKTPAKSSAKRRPRPAAQWQRGLLAVAILVTIVVGVGFLAERLIDKKAAPQKPAKPPAAAKPAAPKALDRTPPTWPKPSAEKAPARPKPSDHPPVFEVYPQTDVPTPPAPTRKPPVDRLPKVAIIIDDLGYDRNMAEKFLLLDSNLTASILPHSPSLAAITALARKRGVETMLHLPMEPNEYPSVNPGSNALLASMAPDELIALLNRNLDSLPDAKGVNNHMGSRLTRESDQMHQIFTVLKQRRLYFVDSRTSADTVGRSTARLFKIPFAERDIFIDHVPTPDFIRSQLEKLVKRAVKQGQAIGIGHPHKTTYEALKEMLPELKKRVQLVPASQVVHAG